jgi:hypothetical protein
MSFLVLLHKERLLANVNMYSYQNTPLEVDTSNVGHGVTVEHYVAKQKAYFVQKCN